jgi:hypothetical protein
MKTKKHSTLFLLPKKYTRKSHHKKVKKHKKQKGGFFLESAAIILGMKYIINRKNINEEWKTGERLSKQDKQSEPDVVEPPAPASAPAPAPASAPAPAPARAQQVTVDDIKICFEKNPANIKESIDLVMGLFFTKVIKMGVDNFRREIKDHLDANPTDPLVTPFRTFADNVPDDKMDSILDSITSSPTTDNITYYSPNSPVYEWVTDNDAKDYLITDITNKIINIFLDKTGIDVTYLYVQTNCDDKGGSDKNFFICNRELNQNHFDVLYRSDAEELRFKIPDSGYCLFAALSLIYIIETLNITVPAELTQHLDANMYGDI